MRKYRSYNRIPPNDCEIKSFEGRQGKRSGMVDSQSQSVSDCLPQNFPLCPSHLCAAVAPPPVNTTTLLHYTETEGLYPAVCPQLLSGSCAVLAVLVSNERLVL